MANRRPLRGAFLIPPPQGAVVDLKRIQVEGYACCGVRPVLVIVRPRHDSCRHRPTASPPIVDCYVDRRLAAARASRFCFSRVANARSRAFSATPCCSDSGRDAIQALSGALPAYLRFQRRVALVHNSRSRSIIALHPEIRGPA